MLCVRRHPPAHTSNEATKDIDLSGFRRFVSIRFIKYYASHTDAIIIGTWFDNVL